MTWYSYTPFYALCTMSFPDSLKITLKKTLSPCNPHHITAHNPTKSNTFMQYADYAAQLTAYKMYFLHGRFKTIT